MPATQYRREDWTLFRQLTTLGQKAGVAAGKIAMLVAKEVTDNALDAVGRCVVHEIPGGGFVVEDDGPGIPGADDEVAELFSVARPLVSSKLLRLPTRGALGNGLRVVAGAVLATGGSLTVKTRGRSLRLAPRYEDGTTTVEAVEPWDGAGTRVEVRLGDALAGAENAFHWADLAVLLAGRGTAYVGKSSPWWYDSDAFLELLSASNGRTVRDLVTDLQGCGGRKASAVAEAYFSRPANTLTRQEAEELLASARQYSKQVRPDRLGAVGDLQDFPGHAKNKGSFTVKPARGKQSAEIPFVVEAWARPSAKPEVTIFVNRTPVTADVEVFRDPRDKTCYALFGCNLSHCFRVGRSREFKLLVNIQSPFLPITNDGKAPDLMPLYQKVLDATVKAARIASRKNRAPATGETRNKKTFVWDVLPEAISKASGGGKYRFSLRQLFYAVRPHFLEEFGEEPSYGTFAKIITAYEARQKADIKSIYRDARGTLYHPHERREIPLGTLNVEGYQRPEWTFNKILYCEKEGFFPVLRDAGWPERNDCALLTSKGFATRAARDTLDLLGETEEEIT